MLLLWEQIYCTIKLPCHQSTTLKLTGSIFFWKHPDTRASSVSGVVSWQLCNDPGGRLPLIHDRLGQLEVLNPVQ